MAGLIDAFIALDRDLAHAVSVTVEPEVHLERMKGNIGYTDQETEKAGEALEGLYDLALNQLPSKEREQWVAKRIKEIVKYEDAELVE